MSSKLNYAKWDNLELSDDSDIEVHPNVDKKSFIRWKQRDIHEKREMRKVRRSQLEAETRTNTDVTPVLKQLKENVSKDGPPFYSREVARLSAGRAERGNKDGPEGPTLDDMVLSLLLQINEEPQVKSAAGDTSVLSERLVEALQSTLEKLAKRQQEIDAELREMDAEDRKKITSDSLHEGFSSGYVAHDDDDEPPKPKPAAKTTQHIETLNAPSTGPSAPAAPASEERDGGYEQDDEDAPELTPTMKEFLRVPSALEPLPLSTQALPNDFRAEKHLRMNAFEATFHFLGSHKELLRESYGTTDALMVEAFQAQIAGKPARARHCLEKGLLVQYCNKLGRDGVSLFFKRMLQADGRAAFVFVNDVLQTYARVVSRASQLAQERASGGDEPQEQIQLMTENPDTVISFQIPDGPPPDHITLEGEGAEQMDPEMVRQFLQRRWDIFQSFDEPFRKALETQQLDQVNKVLGAMPLDKAEKVVGDLQESGILNFKSTEVRLPHRYQTIAH